jgi:iron(III) transport system substrate-binding protein
MSLRGAATTVACLSAIAVLAGCSSSDDEGGTVSAAEKPAGSGDSCGGTAEWDDLVKAAQEEGEVVISGPADTEVSDLLPAAFEDAFGVEVTYVGGSSSELAAKLDAERAADTYSHDVFLGGANTFYTVFYAQKWLADLDDVLIGENLREGDNWVTGEISFEDPDGDKILRISDFQATMLLVNSDLAGDVDEWNDLLDPAFTGKVASLDPRIPGSAANTASQIADVLGRDFVSELYAGQEVAILSDSRQAVDDLARGRYSAVIGPTEADGDEALDLGLPVEWVIPTDAPQHRTASFGLMAVAEPAAHPNAAALMANWLACPQGNEIWTNASGFPSARSDVAIQDPTPSEELRVLDPSREMWDAYDFDFVTKETAENIEYFTEVLGGS